MSSGAITVGLLTLELHITHSHSLKDKRQVLRGLKDRLRGRFNISIAEVGFQDTWKRSLVGVVTVSGEQSRAQETLDRAEEEAVRLLGDDLIGTERDFF